MAQQSLAAQATRREGITKRNAVISEAATVGMSRRRCLGSLLASPQATGGYGLDAIGGDSSTVVCEVGKFR